jgi:hypothetical protein
MISFSCKEATTTEEVETEIEETTTRMYDISPNEEANIALVNEFIDAILNSRFDEAKSMVTSDYMEKGPSAKDSMNVDQMIARWTAVNSERSNQDAGVLIATSLVVNEGDLAGDWVNIWGDYTATLNGSDYKYDVPWHRVVRIIDGKISYAHAWFDNLAPAMDIGSVVPAPAK